MTGPRNEEPIRIPAQRLRHSGVLVNVREWQAYEISEAELEQLASVGTGLAVSQTLASASLGAFAALLPLSLSGDVASEMGRAIVLVSTIASGVLAVAFGVWAVGGLLNRRKAIARIKRGTGPT